jgi:hypothetical protein
MKKTPQSGTWRAGVTVWQEKNRVNQASWHGGEKEYEGADASLSVGLELRHIDSGDTISLFFGLDDDAGDAGSSTAEDKLTISFPVVPSVGKENTFIYSRGDWSAFDSLQSREQGRTAS